MVVEVSGHGSDVVGSGLTIQRVGHCGESDVVESDRAELGVLEVQLAGMIAGVGIPEERKVKAMAVEGDGASVAHVPEGGVDGAGGFEAKDHEYEHRREATADGDEEKCKAAEFRNELLQQIDGLLREV